MKRLFPPLVTIAFALVLSCALALAEDDGVPPAPTEQPAQPSPGETPPDQGQPPEQVQPPAQLPASEQVQPPAQPPSDDVQPPRPPEESPAPQ